MKNKLFMPKNINGRNVFVSVLNKSLYYTKDNGLFELVSIGKYHVKVNLFRGDNFNELATAIYEKLEFVFSDCISLERDIDTLVLKASSNGGSRYTYKEGSYEDIHINTYVFASDDRCFKPGAGVISFNNPSGSVTILRGTLNRDVFKRIVDLMDTFYSTRALCYKLEMAPNRINLNLAGFEDIKGESGIMYKRDNINNIVYKHDSELSFMWCQDKVFDIEVLNMVYISGITEEVNAEDVFRIFDSAVDSLEKYFDRVLESVLDLRLPSIKEIYEIMELLGYKARGSRTYSKGNGVNLRMSPSDEDLVFTFEDIRLYLPRVYVSEEAVTRIESWINKIRKETKSKSVQGTTKSTAAEILAGVK